MHGIPAKTAIAGLVALALAAVAAADPVAAAGRPAFPLKAGADNRHLVDQNNVPFLMVGESPQALIGNLSSEQVTTFVVNRAQYGVNALWVNLLCNGGTRCNSDGTTYDGIAPFTTAEDISTPNPAYFARAEHVLKIAGNHGMVVLLDPIETIGWLGILQSNGPEKAAQYGRYLGRRFKDVPSIIWMCGNDFQSWRNPNDTALIAALMKGIRHTDPNHIATCELDYYVSATLDNPPLRRLTELDAVYTYRPTYAKILQEYGRANFKPIFMVEANYEFEQNGGTDGGKLLNLRKQEYWTMLSGATGQLYGSGYTWGFSGDWENNLDTPGIAQLLLMKHLFAARRWYDLVPDRARKVFTGGRGKFSEDNPFDDDTYVAAAATADGALGMAYLPRIRPVTVDMSKFAGPVTARLYDPAVGTFLDVAGSPFPNTGNRQFVPPGPNHDGDPDWVLVLEAD
jgi:hypothetical protein